MSRRIEDALDLARGELGPVDARELELLKRQIERESGFFCGGYKDRCLRRRLAVRMRARGIHRYGDYASLLRSDPGEYEKLLAALTINVSKFFRNLEVWEIVAERVVPALFELDLPEIRIWSAGSSSGEEAYTIAILLREYAERERLLRKIRRFRIVGSDIDVGILERARRGVYGDMAFGEIPAEMREKWFVGEDRNEIRPEIRGMVEFEELDLLRDPLPREQHLVFCRNVTIYFEREAQESFMTRLHGSLAKGGYLVLGKVETIMGPLARKFGAISQRERIYQCL